MVQWAFLHERRDEILDVDRQFGASNIRVFGSVARGTSDDQSDLDLIVDMEQGRSLLDLGGLLMELQSRLGCRVDVVTERGLKQRIRDEILREAVPL